MLKRLPGTTRSEALAGLDFGTPTQLRPVEYLRFAKRVCPLCMASRLSIRIDRRCTLQCDLEADMAPARVEPCVKWASIKARRKSGYCVPLGPRRCVRSTVSFHSVYFVRRNTVGSIPRTKDTGREARQGTKTGMHVTKSCPPVVSAGKHWVHVYDAMHLVLTRGLYPESPATWNPRRVDDSTRVVGSQVTSGRSAFATKIEPASLSAHLHPRSSCWARGCLTFPLDFPVARDSVSLSTE